VWFEWPPSDLPLGGPRLSATSPQQVEGAMTVAVATLGGSHALIRTNIYSPPSCQSIVKCILSSF
jgi:hypothetical protein